MKTLISALAVLTLSIGVEAQDQRRYISMSIWGGGAGSYSITEGSLPVNMHANGSGSFLHFNGIPLSGSVNGSGSFFSINGGSVYGHINSWGRGNYRVSATVSSPSDAPQNQRVEFEVRAMGRTGDPLNPPRYSIYDYQGAASLSANPSGRSGYTVSGTIDTARFGASKLALVGVAVALAHRENAKKPGPSAETLPETLQRLAPFPLPRP